MQSGVLRRHAGRMQHRPRWDNPAVSGWMWVDQSTSRLRHLSPHRQWEAGLRSAEFRHTTGSLPPNSPFTAPVFGTDLFLPGGIVRHPRYPFTTIAISAEHRRWNVRVRLDPRRAGLVGCFSCGILSQVIRRWCVTAIVGASGYKQQPNVKTQQSPHRPSSVLY